MPSDANYEGQIGAARSQSTFRAVNENLRDFNERFAADSGLYTVACECADDACVVMIEIPEHAYRDVRENPRRFVVAVGHVYPEVERVVEEVEAYMVVEKFERGGEYAEAAARADRASHGVGG